MKLILANSLSPAAAEEECKDEVEDEIKQLQSQSLMDMDELVKSLPPGKFSNLYFKSYFLLFSFNFIETNFMNSRNKNNGKFTHKPSLY